MSASTILIVEDEAIVAMDLAGKLERLGYTVLGPVDRGEEAIELARQHRPSLALMDIRLAGAMDGVTAAEIIRRECDLPVVFLTAHSDSRTLERAKLAEPFGYVIKPFEERELKIAIEMASHKHQAEQQVRQQREWLRVTISSIGDAVIACDTEGRVTFLNPVAEELTGWRASECLGQPIQGVLRLVNEHTRQPQADPVAQVLRTRRPMELANHTALIARDGREIPIDDSAAPILDSSGTVLGAVLVFHDVTQKRRAEEAIQAAHERAEDILQSITDGFFSLDSECRVTYINGRGARLVGKPRAELLGQSLWESFPEAVGTAFQRAYERTLTERVTTCFEAFYPPLNAWFEVRAYPSREGLSVFFQDVSERKRIEEQTRLQAAALQAAANAVAITDGAGAVQWVNDAFSRLTGYSADEVIGRNPRVLKSGEHPPEFYRDMWKTVLDGRVWRGEVVNRRKDGSLYTEEMTITPVPDADGKITHYVAIKQDITERKRMEETLRFLVRAGLKPEEDFFQALAGHLARSLGMEYVCIDRLEEGLLAARTLAVYHDGRFEDNVSYTLKDTPCGSVVGQTVCVFARDVCRRFPKDAVLQELRAESYLGATLWNSRGQPIGLIAVIGRRPLANEALATAILQLVSVRAAGELERRLAERQREAHLARLDALIRLSQQMLAQRTVEDLLGAVVQAARDLTGARLGISGHGYREGVFRVGLVSRGENMPVCPPGDTFRVERGGVYRELIDGRHTIRYTAEELERHPAWWGLPEGHAPLRGLLGARLLGLDGSACGLLMVSDRQQGDFTAEDEALLAQLAALASLALQHLEAREQSDRRAAELKTVFEAMTDAMMIYNAEGVPVEVNPPVIEAYGFDPSGQRPEEFVRRVGISHADGRPVSPSKFPSRRALRGEVVRGERFAFTDAAGQKRFTVTSAAPLSTQGRVTGAVIAWHDVTERERLLQELTRARDELEQRVEDRTVDLKQAVEILRAEIQVRKEAEKHVQGINTLLEVFATRPSRQEYLDAVTALLRKWCGVQAVGVRLIAEDRGLPYAASRGLSRDFLEQERLLCQDGDACACVRVLQGRPRAEDTAALTAFGSFVCNQVSRHVSGLHQPEADVSHLPCVEARFESVAHVPVRFHGQVVGAIHVADRRPGRFVPATLSFLESVAPLLGEALHRFRVEADLRASELRFRSMFESHAAVMLLVDPETGAIVDANPTAARFYGHSVSKLREMRIEHLSLETGLSEGQRPTAAAHPAIRVFHHRLASGATRTVEVHSSPVDVAGRRLLFSIVHDITERKQLEKRILDIGDEERHRIGQDLHDSLGGHLTGLALLGKGLANTLSQQGIPEAEIAREFVQGINDAVAQTRSIARGLCPVGLGKLGLASSLEEYASSVSRMLRVDCRASIRGEVVVRDETVALHLYRIVQEAVNNAVRHGQARNVRIRLTAGKDALILQVRDDGRGLPREVEKARGMGLRTMQYRADVLGARLEVSSRAGKGVLISCRLSLHTLR